MKPIENSSLKQNRITQLFALLFFCFLSFALGGCFLKRDAPDDRVVLKVNEEPLTAKDFAEALAERLRVYDALTVKDERIIKRVKESVLDDFVVQRVSQSYARRNGILVKSENIEASINSIRANYPDDISFRKSLSEQGLSFKEWSERLKGSLLQKLIIEKISSSADSLSTDELRTYYESNKDTFKRSEQIKVSQIVLKNESDANQILEELKKGRSFEDLAKQYSITPEAEKGGDLGWVERGTLDAFDKTAQLGLNKRSGVVKTPYGFHIIEIRGKRPETLLPFEEVKGQISRRILERRQQSTYSQWLEFELKNAKIFKDQALIDAIQVETKN